MEAKEIVEEVYSGQVPWRYIILKDKLTEHGYKWLDWVNGRSRDSYPAEYTACKAAWHKSSNISHSNRGSDESYWCDECKIFWKVDMSD